MAAGLGTFAKSDPGLRAALAGALAAGGDRDVSDVLQLLADAARTTIGSAAAQIHVLAGDLHPELTARSGNAPESAAQLRVPVVVRGQTVGTVRLDGPANEVPDDAQFTDVDRRAAEIIAAIVATEVERVRTIAANRRRERWYTRGSQLARDIAAGRHPEPLKVVADQVREIADAGDVVVIQDGLDGDEPRIAATAGEGSDWERLLRPGAPLDGIQVMRTGRPAAAAFEGRSVLLVPLVSSRGPLGAIALLRDGERAAFSSAEMGMATMLAGQVALALELAEVQDHRDQVKLLEERDRIARDLHDHVIQRLFVIGMSLQHAGLEGAVVSDADGADKLRESVDEIDDAIRQIRATIYRLTGTMTSERLSIRTRAEHLVDDLEPALGFRPVIVAKGPVDLAIDDEEIVEDCTAVLREALTNVARHANATSATVSILLDATELSITVEDDGDGIGESQRRSGLANLRARAERRGGAMTLERGAVGGTRLFWTIPFAEVQGDRFD